MGTVSTRLRQSPHLFDRRILLGGPPALLRCAGEGAAGRGGADELARVQRRRIARDVGTSLEPDSKTDGACRQVKAGASPQTGAVTSSAARTQGTDATGNLGRSWCLETRRAGFIASVDESRAGATNRNQEGRSLCFDMNTRNKTNRLGHWEN